MLELATLGAKVLHNRSVEMAKKYGVTLIVRSSLNNEEGTIVKEAVKKMEKMLITGVAGDKNTARVSAIGVKDEPGIAFSLFHTLAKNNINVENYFTVCRKKRNKRYCLYRFSGRFAGNA